MLEERPLPRFDFVYLDGAHNWFVDGLAFFLADRLLRPGGWIILDDIDWTYETSPALKDLDWVKGMPEDERTTPQVEQIYKILVRAHPNYHHCRLEAGWAFAQKREVEATTSVKYVIDPTSLKYALRGRLRVAKRRLATTRS